jgi:hypothetical protein
MIRKRNANVQSRIGERLIGFLIIDKIGILMRVLKGKVELRKSTNKKGTVKSLSYVSKIVTL